METDISKYKGKSFVLDKALIYIFHIVRDPKQERGTYKYKIYYFNKLSNMISTQYMSDTRLRQLKKADTNLRKEAYERIFNLVFGVLNKDRNAAISEKFHFKELMYRWGNTKVDLPEIR